METVETLERCMGANCGDTHGCMSVNCGGPRGVYGCKLWRHCLVVQLFRGLVISCLVRYTVNTREGLRHFFIGHK